MDTESLYKLIENELEKEAINKFDSKEEYLIWNQEIYNKHKLKAYGLKVPEIEKIVKKFSNSFKELSFKEGINLARMFYTSEYIAQTSFGLKILEISLPKLIPQRFEILDEICGYLTGWGPTDSFSLYIMQPLLRKYPNKVIELLTKWNNSTHIWKKRSSVVTFTRKIGVEGNYVDILLEFCNNLIWDKEDLVRKAVGWALKDNMVGKNKEKVLNYVKNLRKKGVSSTITLYAIRNLKGKEREEILKIKSMK
ncbi:MAG: DNA alkylation repair protein [Candidatus Hermodarchaeota archaeon]